MAAVSPHHAWAFPEEGKAVSAPWGAGALVRSALPRSPAHQFSHWFGTLASISHSGEGGKMRNCRMAKGSLRPQATGRNSLASKVEKRQKPPWGRVGTKCYPMFIFVTPVPSWIQRLWTALLDQAALKFRRPKLSAGGFDDSSAVSSNKWNLASPLHRVIIKWNRGVCVFWKLFDEILGSIQTQESSNTNPVANFQGKEMAAMKVGLMTSFLPDTLSCSFLNLLGEARPPTASTSFGFCTSTSGVRTHPNRTTVTNAEEVYFP